MPRQICMEKIKKQPPRKLTLIKNENRDRRSKDKNPTSIKYVPKGLGSFDFLTSKMVKIVISYSFTGNFFQTENTKCTIFEQNRLIAKHKKKTKKYVGLTSYDILRGW
jgi:hypothetical protein